MDVSLEKIVSSEMMQSIVDQQEEDIPGATMVVGAVLLIEMLHDDGKRYMHFVRPDETTAWQAVGMCTVASQHYVDQCGDD